MNDEQPAGRRSSHLSLRVGASELMLSSADVNVLVEAIAEWRHSLKKALPQLVDKPPALEATTRRIRRLEELEALLIAAPSRLSDPPVTLDANHSKLVRDALGELSGYQRGELTDGLRELKRAVDRLSPSAT